MRAPREDWLPTLLPAKAATLATVYPVFHHADTGSSSAGQSSAACPFLGHAATSSLHATIRSPIKRHDHQADEHDASEEAGTEDRSSRRGSRSSLIKVTRLSSDPHSTLPPPAALSAQAQSDRGRVSSLERSSHHRLPSSSSSTSPSVPHTAPILYLPPLLSPLPTAIAANHKHLHAPTHEELATFNTRLPNIDPASLDLHQALHHFQPVDEHYAQRPYDQAFNWDQLVSLRCGLTSSPPGSICSATL